MSTKKKQRLVAVAVAAGPVQPGEPTIVPLDGGTIEDLMATWRVVHMQPLGAQAESGVASGTLPPGSAPRHLALLLLEENSEPEGLGRLGFGAGS